MVAWWRLSSTSNGIHDPQLNFPFSLKDILVSPRFKLNKLRHCSVLFLIRVNCGKNSPGSGSDNSLLSRF
jgi:hypothetical protein